jgi:alkanesulfonate monooxygenase SsuD/methylene tetrahydromethanopterin reductase-like flavin-dependent oxidoreductase (luciferase family)
MEFGYFLRPGDTYEGMLELARHAEELGLWGAFLNDHAVPLFGDKTQPFLESWTALTGIGIQTKRLRIGHITLMNSMRNPAMLAKMIATLDNMTGGRYETILGTGWMRQEYEGYDLMGRGRGVPSPRERVNRLKETVQILRGMLDNEVFSFEGKYWKLRDAINVPQPVQENIRVSIGARKPRMFRIAAKYCDGVNIQGNLVTIREALKMLVPALERNGKHLDDFFVSGFEHTLAMAKNDEEYDALANRIATRGAFGTGGPTTVENVKENVFVGTPEALVEKMRRVQDLGVKLMIVYVRPASNIEESKEMLSYFKDTVIDRM